MHFSGLARIIMKITVKIIIQILFVYSLNAWSFTESKDKETISIAAIDWCPQICPKDERNGYILDLVKKVFSDNQYQLEVQFYPWSRAIKMVREGKLDALLAPAKAEAPTLIYPDNEVGAQKMCFFTLSNSKWQYTGLTSLTDQQIGIGKDTSIEELNSYLITHPEQFQFQPYIGRYVEQSFRKLSKGRIDSFLFTYNTTKFELTRLKKWHKVRSAGCVNTAKVYLAFSPKIDEQKRSRLIKEFNMRSNQLFKHGAESNIMKNYGLNSWR